MITDEYLVGRLDDIHEKLANIDKTLAVNTEQLTVHIKRTEILETQMQEALIPVRVFKMGVTMGKIASALAAVGSAIWGALKFLHLPR